MRSVLITVCVLLTLFAVGQNDTLREVVIEADRINQPSVTYKVIELKIDDNKNLATVLQNSSGVYLKSYGIGSLTSLSIRGSNASQTQLLWNGFTINSPTLGQTDLSIVSTALVDKASVFLGVSSLSNTSGGLGGAIQLENVPAFGSGTNVSFVQEVGSFGIDNKLVKLKGGTQKYSFSGGLVQRKATNNFTYHDISKQDKPLVIQKNAGFLQQEASWNFFYQPNHRHQFALKSNFRQSFRQIPSVIGSQSNGQHQQDKTGKMMMEWNYNKNNYFQKVAVGYFYDYLNYVDTIADINSKVVTNSLKSYYKGKYYLSDSIQFRFSVQGEKVVANSSGFAENKTQYRTSFYPEFYQLLKNGVSYTLSARKEVISSIKTPVTFAFSSKYSKKKHAIRFSAGQNFRAPTLNDLYWNPGGNPNLKSEKGVLTELGYSFLHKGIKTGITAYYSLIDNWIQWLPQNNGIWQPRNVKKVESKGLEFSLEYKKKIKGVELNIGGNYNLVLATNKQTYLENDVSAGKRLIYVPKNRALFFAKIKIKGFTLSYSQIYNSSVFIDADNRTYMPYFAPANLKLYYTVADEYNAVDLFLKIQNLYNEEYQVMANRPMPGRYLIFGVNIKLQSKKR